MTLRIMMLMFFTSLACAQAPARIASLDWLAGAWIHDEGRGQVEESWLGPGGGKMVAANLTVFASGRSTFEHLRIVETAEGLAYLASPNGRAPVEFKLKEQGPRRVVFENPSHDFPQRILYWRDGDALVARIEGLRDGQPRHLEWRFRRK